MYRFRVARDIDDFIGRSLEEIFGGEDTQPCDTEVDATCVEGSPSCSRATAAAAEGFRFEVVGL